MKRVIFVILFSVGCFFAISFPVFSQNAKIKWVIKPEPAKVFIENKGQFPVTNHGMIDSKEILYAYDGGSVMIYFSRKGLTFTLNKKIFNDWYEEHPQEKNRDDLYEKEKEEQQAKTVSDMIRIEWAGANDDAEIIASDPTGDYYSYAIRNGRELKNISHLRAFKKLLFKEVYKGIDIQFVFHPDKGLEYSLIVHPGADISGFKMKCTDGKSLKINKTLDLHIQTKLGDIIETAPKAYYNDNKKSCILCSFEKNKNSVSFSLGDFDHSRTVIIDPWIINPVIPNGSRVWAIDKDDYGNAFIYGGDMPVTLQKYSPAGTLLWSYATPWDSTGYWVGTMITDRAGNAYITSGSNGEISKIDSSGSIVWHNNPNGSLGPLYEYWDLAFNSSETQLVVCGMRTSSAMGISSYRGAVANISLLDGSILGFRIVGPIEGMVIQEARTLTGAPNGNFYFLTLDSIGGINPLMNILWKESNTYHFAYRNPKYQLNGNLGIRAIRANDNYIYTQSGSTLHKRNIANGAIIDSAGIPGGIYVIVPMQNDYEIGNSGLELDSCGNIYVGSGTGVYKYDDDLNLIDSVITPSAVYDVAVTGNGEILACGNGYALSAELSSCNPYRMGNCPRINIHFSNVADADCFGNPGQFEAVPVGATPPYTYFLQNSAGDTIGNYTGVQGSQAFFSLPADSYMLLITDSNHCSAVNSVRIISRMLPGPVITDTGSLTCHGGGLVELRAPAGYATYLWSNGDTTSASTITQPGYYSVSVTDSMGCPAQSVPFHVGASSFSMPEICVVTVDSTSDHNVISWNKPASSELEQYHIYREGSQPNVFSLVGIVPYNSENFFVDNSSAPLQRANRYRISATDTCGFETELSNIHKSMYLTISQGIGNTCNLAWSHYEGFSLPPTYDIYSGTSPANLTLHRTVSSSLNSYTDSYLLSGNIYYQVSVDNPNGCAPSNIYSSGAKSNIVGYYYTGMDGNRIQGNRIKIYPNPANDYLSIDLQDLPMTNKASLEFFSIDGKLIKKTSICSRNSKVNIENLHPGIYFIKLIDASNVIVSKLIKN